ncbi:MAG: hypothetical protein K2J38_02495, partial [Muribaculaceae bacterium]|nr:hypothetical protein [Muribaculaceae bacterium]
MDTDDVKLLLTVLITLAIALYEYFRKNKREAKAAAARRAVARAAVMHDEYSPEMQTLTAPAGPMPQAPELPEEGGPRKSVPEHHAEESRQPQPADNEAP